MAVDRPLMTPVSCSLGATEVELSETGRMGEWANHQQSRSLRPRRAALSIRECHVRSAVATITPAATLTLRMSPQSAEDSADGIPWHRGPIGFPGTIHNVRANWYSTYTTHCRLSSSKEWPMADPILVAKSPGDLVLLPRLANRHGLIAGATGTGKTVTLQRLAEGFSRIGVPVFMADVKGDLSGISRPANPPKKPVLERIAKLGLADEFKPAACPTVFWDVFGEQGHPVPRLFPRWGPLGPPTRLNDTRRRPGHHLQGRRR